MLLPWAPRLPEPAMSSEQSWGEVRRAVRCWQRGSCQRWGGSAIPWCHPCPNPGPSLLPWVRCPTRGSTTCPLRPSLGLEVDLITAGQRSQYRAAQWCQQSRDKSGMGRRRLHSSSWGGRGWGVPGREVALRAQDPPPRVAAASLRSDLGGGQSPVLPIAANTAQGCVAPHAVGFSWLLGLCVRAGAALCPYLMAHQEERVPLVCNRCVLQLLPAASCWGG